jgi:spore coat protein U-like protein
VGGAGGLAAAQAQTMTAALVPAPVDPASCQIASIQGIDFGAGARPFAPPVDAVGALSLSCTRETPFTLALASGVGPGATTAVRRMPGADWKWFVAYSLYKDEARTELWGDGGNALVIGTAGVRPRTLGVYGRVPAQPAPPDGAYSDLVAVTISY